MMMNTVQLYVNTLVICLLFGNGANAMLYPKESSNREVKELNGLWHFRADFSEDRNEGFTKQWYNQPLSKTGDILLMPVPSSFNDITQDPLLRDFVGWVWYDRQFWLPQAWTDGRTRIMIQFGSAHYNAIAWINGHRFTNHSGGHLPFEGEVTSYVRVGRPNTLTVAINNTLGPHTLPPGSLSFFGPPVFSESFFRQNVQMDFFNYAGLHRPVKLYTTPLAAHIDDITIITSLQANGSASVDYVVEVVGTQFEDASVHVKLMDRTGIEVASVSQPIAMCNEHVCSNKVSGNVHIDEPNLWWPWTMSDTPGYLYVFQVNVTANDVEDIYRQPMGVRTVSLVGTDFLINGEPFYFHGFGKHEDADIRGKGLDFPLLMKDINLLLWLGANSFRTSHYPYSEELMDLCDKYGIVVIDETPAVGLKTEENFGSETLKHHITVTQELLQRDKNHPSVVMWSLANEPKSSLFIAESYFQKLAEVTKSLDSTRPITFASNSGYASDRAVQFMDVICVNRYYAWYHSSGHPETIHDSLSYELTHWYGRHKKPIIMTEYGASSVAGIHEDPPTMFSEDYQVEVLAETFPVFDKYKNKFLIGEMVWNFADFATKQATKRVNGNKKGVLTRQRQPKAAARLIRARYHSLAQGKQFCDKSPYLGILSSFCPEKSFM